MDTKNILMYPRIPIPVAIPEWKNAELQLMPLVEDAFAEEDIQKVYINTGHGVLYLEAPINLLHWMFNRQIEDKSGALHETDTAAWLNIALGPVLDMAEKIFPAFKCSVVDAQDLDEIGCFITGLIDVYGTDDDGDQMCHTLPCRVWVPQGVWQYIRGEIQNLPVDVTQDMMPVACDVLGGIISLNHKDINQLAVGDLITLKETPLNKGGAILRSNLVPDTPIEIRDNSLILAEGLQLNMYDIDEQDFALTIKLGRIHTTVGQIRSLAEEENYHLMCDEAFGQKVDLFYNEQQVATGALWVLGGVFGLRIEDMPNG